MNKTTHLTYVQKVARFMKSITWGCSDQDTNLHGSLYCSLESAITIAVRLGGPSIEQSKSGLITFAELQ